MKHFKLLQRNGRVYILKYSIGLFGSQYEPIASFEGQPKNVDRCKQIVKLLNQCDKND